MSITWRHALSDDGSLKNISEITDAYRMSCRFTCFGHDNEFGLRGLGSLILKIDGKNMYSNC